MNPLDPSGAPQSTSPLHTLPNYVFAVVAIGIFLFAAGAFGIIRKERRVHAPKKPAEHFSASVQEAKKAAPKWVRYADLTVPVGTGVYTECGETDCGETTVITYDGVPPPGLIRTELPTGPTWPDMRLTALTRSAKLTYFPRGVDIDTLEVTPSGSYARDKNGVYFLSCVTYGCGYDPLTGLDPASFDPDTYAPIRSR